MVDDEGTRTDGTGDVTRLLNLFTEDRPGARSELTATVYGELRSLAARQMAGERGDHTLQATALVHEAYVRLVGDPSLRWESRRHFFAAASEAMRRILVDHARARGTRKRGGGWRGLSLEAVDLAREEDRAGILALDEALSRLEGVDARAAEVVRLRFFAGLDVDETVRVAGRSRRTVLRDWAFAKAWLADALRASENATRPGDRR